MQRCTWVPKGDELYREYHDKEWGVPLHDDRRLFEFLILEGAQAGLSWRSILARRQSYREAFDNFDPAKVANYDEAKVNSLLQDPGIIRNRRKIQSAIRNAKVFMEIQAEHGSFDSYLWSWVDFKSILTGLENLDFPPATTELSDQISRDLKTRGMSFVGSTIIYAYLQAVGVVMDHPKGCFRHQELSGHEKA